LGGLRTGLRIPGLRPADFVGRVLAKAELVVPISGSSNPDLFPPNQLFVFRRTVAGGDAFLPDQLQGTGVIDGIYSSADKSYRFNITRYAQRRLSGDILDDVLELVPGSNGISPARAVLAGPAHQDGGIRLELTFTTY
jgi:hypothetical protein